MASPPPSGIANVLRGIAQQLDAARRRQGLSMEELATRAGLTPAATQELLIHGRSSMENFLRVLYALGLLEQFVNLTATPRVPIEQLTPRQAYFYLLHAPSLTPEASLALRNRCRGLTGPALLTGSELDFYLRR
jgi:transcriptional regulator with XRE-family HTH domain